MTSELAWQCAGVGAPKNRGACRCGSSPLTEVGAIGLVAVYGTLVMLWESRRFNSGYVEAKERKSSNFRAAIVPIDFGGCEHRRRANGRNHSWS
jgi:hypothetical protein